MEQIIISGFGGQGALFVGKLLAYAGMVTGKNVSWIPSYGPEMRGGTANCSVVISDKEITSPIVNTGSILLAFNEPSVDKFIPDIKKDGIVFLNGSIIKKEKPENSDFTWVSIPAQQIAEELGAPSLMNMVMLGALLKHISIIDIDGIKKGMEEMLGNKRPDRIEMNLAAIKKGIEIADVEVQYV
ncbi:2-oxoacid:acceptor oxidoreductase family protein [Tepidibacillus marianensis]|uniref:2-oxoacid:acceptor oxidoreductase family protein n=1 Tax=Tepidibacillus marianensis TaxID=3131995 RepID=UPI0030CB75D9